MKITIRNHITIDGQIERIHEEFDGKLQELAGKTCLLYQNAEQEKVLVKFDNMELSMTRYAQNPVTMRFHKINPTSTFYQGLGQLSILTDEFDWDQSKNKIRIHYRLLQNDQLIGHYRLRIDWKA